MYDVNIKGGLFGRRKQSSGREELGQVGGRNGGVNVVRSMTLLNKSVIMS